MKTLTFLVTVLWALPALAGMGTSAGHDLDALWQTARSAYDLDDQDAVILLHDTRVTVTADGDIATRVHTAVWIGTSRGIRDYADLRVPWNRANSTLDVEILRTWRDGTWWPDAERISGTAVVHTLPHALRTAYDYGEMRETMLLHDGIELPCIVETAYTVTEQGRPLAAGVFTASQADPAVQVSCTVSVPDGVGLVHHELNGLPGPQPGDSTISWTLLQVPPRAWPATGHPLRHEPAALWTTADGDAGLAAAWHTAFEAAVAAYDSADLGPDLAAAVAGVPGGVAEVRAVADFLAGSVRTVAYDDDEWRYRPRPARRVWSTAYGHTLDRAVLLTAVLRGLGHTVEPRFAPVLAHSPRHAVQAGELVLHVELPGSLVGGVDIDPAHGTLHDPFAFGDAVPARAPDPQPARREDTPDQLEITLVLAPGDDGAWTGTGRLAALGRLAPGHVRFGAPGDLERHLQGVVASVLVSATIDDLTTQVATGGRFAAEFTLALPAVAGEREFVFGSPSVGYPAALPHDVSLADAARQSPVVAGGPLRQSVEVRLDLADWQASHLPGARAIATAAGGFGVAVSDEGGRVTYRRELEIDGGYGAGDWPELRRLLLEEVDPANGVIVLTP